MRSRRISLLVNAVFADATSVAAFRADPEAFYDRFELDEDERNCFRKPSLESLDKVGVHALQQYRFMLVLNPPPAGRPPISYYLDHLED